MSIFVTAENRFGRVECTGGTPVSGNDRIGFTLIEMALSLAIVGIILAAVESLIVLSARSIDNGTSLTARAQAGRWAADQLAADVRLATTMASPTTNQISFSVPDRAGGVGTNTIVYGWTGAGAPLTRSVNGGNAAVLANNVQLVSLVTQTQTITAPAPIPAVPTTTANGVVLSYDTSSNGSLTTTKTVTSSTWIAQTFKPTFAGSPMYWTLTDVKLYLCRASLLSLGSVTVEIHPCDASMHPTATVLDSYMLDTTLLGLTPFWFDFTFSNLTAMDPNQYYAIVVKTSSALVSLNVNYDNKSTSPANLLMSTSTGGGNPTWTNASTSTADMYIYGTVTNP